MFFSRFFNKDYSYYHQRGEKFYADQKYADARHEYLAALEKLPSDENAVRDQIAARLKEAGNHLGFINLAEAEQLILRGNPVKALEHVELVLTLSDDPLLREKALALQETLHAPVATASSAPSSSHCGGCAPAPEPADVSTSDLSPQEAFELTIQTLPGALPQRYMAMGDDFMSAYLKIHGGEETAGARILQDMLQEREDDIILYELAVLSFRAGDTARCEKLLRRALVVNDDNPLCYLSLVQLLADTGRLEDASELLHHMIDRTILVEQALIFLGDIHQRVGDDAAAIAELSKALAYPGVAKPAAERLVPLLTKQGRMEDAAFLVKKYLKGCC